MRGQGQLERGSAVAKHTVFFGGAAGGAPGADGEAHGCALLPGEVVNTHGPVEPDKDNIRQEPYTLPQGFTWDALDLGDRGVVSRPGAPFAGSPAGTAKQPLLGPSPRAL